MKAIDFDLGGVLIDWNPRHLYSRIFADEQEMEHFLAEVCPMSWNVEMDGGKPFAQGCAERVALFARYEREINAYFTCWPEMLGGALEGTVQLLQELKQKGYPVYALTNWSAETFPFAQQKFPFLKEFDGIVMSGEEKCVKPDARLYKILLTRYQLASKDCFFTDDNPANIETARGLGFDACLFTGAENLRAALTQRGVL